MRQDENYDRLWKAVGVPVVVIVVEMVMVVVLMMSIPNIRMLLQHQAEHVAVVQGPSKIGYFSDNTYMKETINDLGYRSTNCMTQTDICTT
jgi:hypothetical protein